MNDWEMPLLVLVATFIVGMGAGGLIEQKVSASIVISRHANGWEVRDGVQGETFLITEAWTEREPGRPTDPDDPASDIFTLVEPSRSSCEIWTLILEARR